MIILGIESSCDETAAAVVQKQGNRITILSNVVASSADLQAKYGGVIPEQAAREQLKSIIPVIKEALQESRVKSQDIDAIAVTEGPGLIGSLLVGVETAKVLATVWNKPLIPVNHLLAHFYANWVNQPLAISNSLFANQKQTAKSKQPTFPAIGLLVSGGHTDLILMTGHGKYQYLGGTRDDAAGECFDKSARLLGLPYPGGPAISKLAEKGNPQAFKLPRPMIESGNFSAKGGPAYGWDFSFSGLKTAISNIVSSWELVVGSTNTTNNEQRTQNLAASIEEAIIDVLVKKTFKAVHAFKVKQIIVAGGVAANQTLAKKIMAYTLQKKLDVRIFIPEPKVCTDNAVYISTSAFFNYHPIRPIELQANPNLSLS